MIGAFIHVHPRELFIVVESAVSPLRETDVISYLQTHS
jgi:hypothetical protein